MLFNSLEFAIFFPVVTGIFFLLSRRWQVPWLLAASCVFYMAFIPAYLLILVVTILIDYVAGIYLERVSGSRRRWLLGISVVSTCMVLFVFKYFAFFTGSFVGLTNLLGGHLSRPLVHIILPIGLSFHTFQSLSYVVEVYRGNQKAERNFVVYATYVMFFPQLVAGPIERPQNLLHQFREPHRLDYSNLRAGLRRMAWGFFKKLVIADRLALYVNDVYAAPRHFQGAQLTIATVFFAYQIYCDFSGYSDIAIGAAQVLGFHLMENFRTPYYARSISEFWHRWHISLSTWFKDYVYIPLGGSRVAKPRHVANLLITFLLSGLWHGANWTFVAWGALNGLYLVAGWLTQGWRDRLFGALGIAPDGAIRRASKWSSTFVLTCAAWILFRARSMGDAAYVLTHLGRGWNLHSLATEQFLLRQFPLAIAAVVVLELGQQWHQRVSVPAFLGRLPVVPRWALYAGFVIAVLLCGIYQRAQFLYFQF
jgi:alginate O-acetyltransferase complex protein AlgI